MRRAFPAFIILCMLAAVVWSYQTTPTAKVTSEGGPSIAQAQQEAYNGPKARIAVAQFKDKTRKGWWSGQIGDGMADMLATSLFNTNRYIVLERHILGDVLAEQDLGASGRVKKQTAAPIGQLEGAELLITGAVTEFEPGTSGVGRDFGGTVGKVIQSNHPDYVKGDIVEGMLGWQEYAVSNGRGLRRRHGYIVAEWGDTRRVDVSFSVAKSYLSIVTGLAFDRGLIADVDRPVRELVRDGGFDSDHNRSITWRHLLTQTSEWEGTLWAKPDVADRRLGYDRALQAPGAVWEYNDVRVNRLALSLLRVWQRPLPGVLREYVMDPIGASDTWRWYGYYNSYVDIGGRYVQSVSGGTHWGGGIWMSSRDHARVGYLMLRHGRWAGRQVLSDRWLEQALSPTPRGV